MKADWFSTISMHADSRRKDIHEDFHPIHPPRPDGWRYPELDAGTIAVVRTGQQIPGSPSQTHRNLSARRQFGSDGASFRPKIE